MDPTAHFVRDCVFRGSAAAASLKRLGGFLVPDRRALASSAAALPRPH